MTGNLTGINLSGANWSGVTGLFGPNLSSANLSGVDFSSTRISAVTLTLANLHNADLRNGTASFAVSAAQLLSAADVTGVNLSGNNLSGFVLTGVNLSGANLSGTNLFNAKFNSANLTGALVATSLLRNVDFEGANLSSTALGDGTRFDGFIYEGRLDIGAGTTTLNSLAFANLGTLTTIAGGTLAAPNGVSLGVGRVIAGAGTVAGKVAGSTGSTIAASGNLALGNAVSPVGFTTDGELYTGTNAVTLNDSNQAVLGSLTQLGSGGVSGTLNATHGVYVDFGRNLVGQGTVNGNNALADATIINGSVQGTGSGLLFTGYVKGQGTFSGSVTFGGTYSPGLSPASVNVEDLSLLATSTLVMELGGLTAGSQYDQINASDTLLLDGLLALELINGFTPALGNTFDLFNGTLDGAFDAMLLPALAGDLLWDTTQLTQNGIISVVPEPASAVLLLGSAGMLLLRRHRAAAVGTRLS